MGFTSQMTDLPSPLENLVKLYTDGEGKIGYKYHVHLVYIHHWCIGGEDLIPFSIWVYGTNEEHLHYKHHFGIPRCCVEEHTFLFPFFLSNRYRS